MNKIKLFNQDKELRKLLKISQIVAIDRADNWLIYHRLQQLEISCQYAANKPLRFELKQTKDLIQFWSVLKQFYSTRQELISWLNNCWQSQCDRSG